jgi:hypothetical protein
MVRVRDRARKVFLTAEEAVERIEALCKTAEGDVVAVADITSILEQTAIGGVLSYQGIKAGILETLNRAHSGGNMKLASAQIYAYLSRAGDKVPIGTIDKLLMELEEEGAVHCDKSGALTVWGVGRAPATAEQTS